jgi:hypothetical protein
MPIHEQIFLQSKYCPKSAIAAPLTASPIKPRSELGSNTNEMFITDPSTHPSGIRLMTETNPQEPTIKNEWGQDEPWL